MVNNSSKMYGNSSYNSLQMKVQKRFRGGSSLLGAYTFSKLIANTDTMTAWLEQSGQSSIQNYYDIKSEKAVVSQDVPHRLVISYVLDLPVGKGKSLLSGVHGLTDKLVSGWVVSGTSTFQSGWPLVFTAQPTTLSSTFGAGTPRPNFVPGCELSMPGRAQDRLNKWFNTACFTQPGAFEFGNAPRTETYVRAMGTNNWDMSISKITTLRENWQLRFEAQVFNLANRARFGQPNSQLGNVNFGIITQAGNQPRVMQFALRLTF